MISGERRTGADPGISGDRLTGAGLVLIAIFAIQIGSALATTIFDEVGPGGTVLLRMAIGALVLLAIWRPARAAFRGRALRDVVAFGFVLAGMNLAFFLAIDRIPLGIAVTLEFAGPLTVAIAMSRRRLDLVWIALAALGIVLLAPSVGDDLDGLGVAFALIAGAFWGIYLLVSARVGRGPTGHGGLAVAMALAALFLLPIGIAEGGSTLLEPEVLAIGVVIAVVGSAIPFTCELEALRRLSEGTVGILLSAEPAVAALTGFIALDQGLATSEVAAMACVIAASAGALSTAPSIETTQA